MKVQVKVRTTDEGSSLFLEDASGIFLEVPLEKDDEPEVKLTSSDRVLEDEQLVEFLQQAVHIARLENETLMEELNAVKSELENSKKRVCELWEVGCDALLFLIQL